MGSARSRAADLVPAGDDPFRGGTGRGRAIGDRDDIWSQLATEDLSRAIAAAEPIEQVIPADESKLGKLSVPNRILDKPGTLDSEEWNVVRQHPYLTYEILARVPVFLEFAYDASCHHERWWR